MVELNGLGEIRTIRDVGRSGWGSAPTVVMGLSLANQLIMEVSNCRWLPTLYRPSMLNEQNTTAECPSAHATADTSVSELIG